MFFSRTIESNRKKRKRTKAHLLKFERFEPRHLMAADGVVASYGSDFGSQGWTYTYNVGGQELQSNGGNLTALTNINGNYSVPNGDPSSRFLFLNQVGGHPGAPQSDATGNTVDQYAVVTWEVPESGYYEIADSRLEVPNGSGDGVEFRVYVNNDAPVTTGIASPSRISYFDSRLGFLRKGDSVRVAFGANGNDSFDYFETDFNFVRNNQLLQTVGNLEDAFTQQSPSASLTDASDWRLLWNAPENWQPFGPSFSSTHLATGGIDQPENFRPLFQAAGGPVWTADANLQPTGDPDGFLNFSAEPVSHPDLPDTPLFTGHPGAGYGSSSAYEDRFAIVEFTVSQSGYYAINNSLFSLDERSSGVEVVVGTSVDPASFRTNITASGLVQSEFDVSLGALSRGDKIYVAIGAGGFHNSDRFATNFDVVRVLPRELPLRQLPAPQVTFHASDIEGLQTNDRQNDYWGLKALFDQAAAVAAASDDDAPVRVVLQPGIYNIAAPEGFTDRSLFSFTNVHGLEIEGNGAELFVESPLLGLFTVTASSEVILQNFQVDYVERYIDSDQSIDQDVYRATTISQARVVGSPNFSDNSIVVRFDPSVTVAPDRQFFSEAASPQVFASLIDPNVAGRTKFNTDHFIELNRELSGQQLSATDYRIVFENPEHLQQVVANDQIAFQRRDNTAIVSIFADQSADSSSAPVFNGSSDITLSNVTAWSSPGTFVSSIGTERLNVIDSRVSVRFGRWRSISADALHIQSSREGAWVENSDFAGGADDVSNFYTLPLAINQRLLNPRELVVTAVTPDEKLSINRDLYQEGDRLQFFDPVKGEVIQEARIASVGQTIERDGVTMVKLTFDQPIDSAARPYIESDVEGFGNDTQIFNRDLSKNFLVQGSQFRNTRRYGTFLMSENVQIVDSLYSGLSDAAIAGHNEASWPLGNLPSDVLIQNNRFNSIGFSREYLSQDYATGVISFQIDSAQLGREFGRQVVDRLSAGVTNLNIRDNTFRLWGKAAISVRNAQNVTIHGNQIYWYGADGASTPLSPIEVAYSSDVQVTGTSFLQSDRTDIDNFFATEGNGEGNVLEAPGFI